MNCEQAEMHLAGLLADELEQELRQRVAAHVDSCAACGQKLGDMRVTLELLRESIEDAPAPKLSPKRRAVLAAAVAATSVERSTSQDRRRWAVSLWRLGAIAAVLFLCAALISVFLPALGAARDQAKRVESAHNMKEIATGQAFYLNVNNERHPGDIGAVIQYIEPEVLVSPLDDVDVPSDFERWPRDERAQWARENSSYVLLGRGRKADGKTETITGFEKFGKNRRRVALSFGDGHVKSYHLDEARRLIETQERKPVELLVAESKRPLQDERLSLANERLALGHGARGLETSSSVSLDGRLFVTERSIRPDSMELRTPENDGEPGDLIGSIVRYNNDYGRADALLVPEGGSADFAEMLGSAEGVPNFNNASDFDLNSGFTNGAAVPGRESDRLMGRQLRETSSGDADAEHESSQRLAGGRWRGEGWGARVGFGDGHTEFERDRSSGRVSQDSFSSEVLAEQGLGRNGSPQNRRAPMSKRLGRDPDDARSDAELDRRNRVIALGDVTRGNATEFGGGKVGESPVASAESAEHETDKSRDQRPANTEDTKQRHGYFVDLGDVSEITGQQAKEHAASGPAVEEPSDDPPAQIQQPPLPVNPWVMTAADRFCTFALESDTASFALARQFLMRQGTLPPRNLIRMEEFVNTFDYNYPTNGGGTFAIHGEAAPSPFRPALTLLKVGVKGRIIGRDGRKAAHLVFVVDTSGSMDQPDRLPLVQHSIELVAEQLTASDRVSLITYGTRAQLVAEQVRGDQKQKLLEVARAIRCAGSTNLLEGVRLGYETARKGFAPGQINRVILCSDGVANVGPSDAEELVQHVEAFRDHGVTFTSVGFGADTYNDCLLEQLANRGDGNYVFVDSRKQAEHVFVDQITATLQTIALDAKIQVEFDPKRVRRYRLIGYENRDIADNDFRNDRIDAGEIGSGQSATALYEVELLEDQDAAARADLGTVYVRYVAAESGKVEEISTRLTSTIVRQRKPADDPRFYLAACAAEFAELLRGSEHAMDGSYEKVERVLSRACEALPLDTAAQELLEMVRRARELQQ